MNYDKTDASSHDTELDNMHEDVELADNQIEFQETVMNNVLRFKEFICDIQSEFNVELDHDELINMLDKIAHCGWELGDFPNMLPDPEYPDREPS